MTQRKPTFLLAGSLIGLAALTLVGLGAGVVTASLWFLGHRRGKT